LFAAMPLTASAAGVVVNTISAGTNITAIIKEDGSLWTTGSNEEGGLGVGINTSELSHTATFIKVMDSFVKPRKGFSGSFLSGPLRWTCPPCPC
jgi:alpha-tubulin suppressor-like RCC1 family protein